MTERSLQCRDAVQKLRGVLDAQLLDVIVNYIGELQSSLKSAEQLVATMLEAQEQLSHEAKAELNKFYQSYKLWRLFGHTGTATVVA
jgi:hypothetical protein